MKKRRGFTLIELIAVIVILAIISFLIVPSIINVLRDSREDLYQEQVGLVLDAAKNYGVENFENLDEYNLNFITIDELASNGFIEGDEAIDPRDNSKMEGCVMVSYDHNNEKFDYEYLADCDRNKYANILEITDNYTGDWQPEIIVEIKTSYLAEDENTTYRYCISTTKCTPNIGVDAPSGSVNVNVESPNTYVCAVSVTSTGQESETKCVGPFKIDKTAPILTIPGDEELDSLVTTYDFTKGVTATDNITASEDITITRTGNISLGTLGEYTITYTARDEAGNVAIKTRKVKVVDITPPNIEIAVAGSPFGSNGWALNGFNVSVTATDKGGSGVSGYKYCVSSGAACTPTTSASGATGTFGAHIDGDSIYACAYSIDGSGNVSGTKCVGPYKIDETNPTCTLTASGASIGGYFTGTGTINFNNYSSDVTSYGMNKTGSPVYDGTSVQYQTTDTEGQKIYGYVKDRAGRVGQCEVTVKRDTTAPTCSLKIDTAAANGNWRNQNTVVSFNTKSSDVTSYDVKTSAGASYNNNASATVVDNTPASGQLVYGYVKDRVGLTGSCSTTVYLDKTGPYAPSVTSTGKTATVTSNGTSGSSGVCWYQVDNGAKQTSGTFSNLTYGNHTAKAISCSGVVGSSTTFTIVPHVTIKNSSSPCVWQCTDSKGKNCPPDVFCNTKKSLKISSSSVSATYTSATQIKVVVKGSINTGSSYLYTGGESYERYICLANHHENPTGKSYCKSTSSLIKASNVSWYENSSYSFNVELTLNNPSGCYDIMIYGGGSYGNQHVTANIPSVLCTS